MENNLKITKTKENNFEFEVEIEGVDAKDMKIRLMIVVSDMTLCFDAKHVEGSKWSVKIPALSILDKTTYPFFIDAIVDGYHFEPMKGSITVTGSAEIYVTEPKNVTMAPPSEEKKEDKKDEPKKEEVKETMSGKGKFFTIADVRAAADRAVNVERDNGDTRPRDAIISDLLKKHSEPLKEVKAEATPVVVPPIELKKIGVKESKTLSRKPVKAKVLTESSNVLPTSLRKKGEVTH